MHLNDESQSKNAQNVNERLHVPIKIIKEAHSNSELFKTKHTKSFLDNELDIIIKNNFGGLIESIKKSIKKKEKIAIEKQRLDIIKSEWNDAAFVLDRFLFYFFTLTIITISVVMYLNSLAIFGQEK